MFKKLLLGTFCLTFSLNLETAVQSDKVMLDFKSESLSTGADHSQKVKAATVGSGYGSKDYVNLSLSTAVFRLNAQQVEKDSLEAIIQNNNRFSIELFKSVNQRQVNLSLSTYSVGSALVMLLPGAKGRTLTEIQSVLHTSNTPEKMIELYSELNQKIFSRLSETSNELRLIQANSLWVKSRLTINSAFSDLMNKYYRGAFRQLNFPYQYETARSEINNWVTDKTLHQIPFMLLNGEINAKTQMVLISTAFIKARWARPFNKELTHQEIFINDDETVISVPTMVDGGDYGYFDTGTLELVKIPFVSQTTQNAQLALVILYPKNRGRLNAIIQEITHETLQTWLVAMKDQRVQLMLPKFKIASSHIFNNDLVNMGMPEAFSERADFSGISSAPLSLSIVKQKAFVEIDESGMGFAVSSNLSLPTQPTTEENRPVAVTVKHPFAYILYETKTGAILFAGKVMNPNL